MTAGQCIFRGRPFRSCATRRKHPCDRLAFGSTLACTPTRARLSRTGFRFHPIRSNGSSASSSCAHSPPDWRWASPSLRRRHLWASTPTRISDVPTLTGPLLRNELDELDAPTDDEIHLRDWWSGLLPRQGYRRGLARTTSRRARAPRHHAEVRPVPECRSRDDVAISARRGLRHRRRGGDRSRSRPLRALYRPVALAGE